jgi:hypothetical protein
MKKATILLGCLILCGLISVVNAQTRHKDPPFMVAMSTEKPLTIDGKLDENDWQRRIFSINFRAKYVPDDGSYSVSGSDLPTRTLVGTKGYSDTSSAALFFLHKGTELYVGLKSTDSSVCKRWGSWEGDGLYIKVKSKAGLEIEYKLMYNSDTATTRAVLETSANAPSSSAIGASYNFTGTIPNDNTSKDKGYSLELNIHLAKLGYTVIDTIPIVVTVMDPDFYTKTEVDTTAPAKVQFYKSWWGSEWGASYSKLILGDTPIAEAYATTKAITLDGKLDEPEWNHVPSIVIAPGSKDATGWYYMQWGDTLNTYDDPSTTIVKFLHKGTDLYIGYISNDSSVGNINAYSAGWEADGIDIWMRDKFSIPDKAHRQEIQMIYTSFDTTKTAPLILNTFIPTPTSVEGASYNLPGTVPMSERAGKDRGYSGELVIHGADWGYAAGDTMLMAIIMWDMDHGSPDVTDGTPNHFTDYAKAWWGCEWAEPGPTGFDKYYLYRGVVLSPTQVQAVGEEHQILPIEFSLGQNYPNPFNPSTTISYSLTAESFVSLKVYDVLGQEVASLIQQKEKRGYHEVSFNANNLSSGVYLYRLEAGSLIATKKMILMK